MEYNKICFENFRIPIFKPMEAKVRYWYKRKKDDKVRINTPWEIEIKILESKEIGEAVLDVEIFNYSRRVDSDFICNVIKEVFEYYKDRKFTIGLENGWNTLKVEIFEDYIEGKDIFGGNLRGKTVGYFPIGHIKISVKGCEDTIRNEYDKFLERYGDEFGDHVWQLDGMIAYVVAHEIAHICSPKYLQYASDNISSAKSEILAILYGSQFAFEKGYIYVPHGKWLKKYWADLGIIISEQIPIDLLDFLEENLKRCEREIESWLCVDY